MAFWPCGGVCFLGGRADVVRGEAHSFDNSVRIANRLWQSNVLPPLQSDVRGRAVLVSDLLLVAPGETARPHHVVRS